MLTLWKYIQNKHNFHTWVYQILSPTYNPFQMSICTLEIYVILACICILYTHIIVYKVNCAAKFSNRCLHLNSIFLLSLWLYYLPRLLHFWHLIFSQYSSVYPFSNSNHNRWQSAFFGYFVENLMKLSFTFYPTSREKYVFRLSHRVISFLALFSLCFFFNYAGYPSILCKLQSFYTFLFSP